MSIRHDLEEQASDTLLPTAPAMFPFPCSEAEDLLYEGRGYDVVAPLGKGGVWDPHRPPAFQEPECFSLLRPLRDKLQEGADAISEAGSIRATLLVNFGKDSKHNKYGFIIEDKGTTHSLLIQVLEKLTAKK